MKRLLLVGLLLISQFAMSQTPAPKIVKDHYTVSGGLLGALNFNKYRDVDNNILDYFFQSGWAAGGWVNIPLGNRFSLEPQLMYSKYRYKSSDVESLMKDGNVSFISIPVLLKWHIAEKFAITAG
ncbi:MAG TPA: outer membrane beta-barrel protein, partial [Chitinophagaceae bacterium]|nr:outer membrane beta-barrel protein [Chitinophagaceae bacterium]